MSNEVIIYTDGACSGNPGPGGWAALLMYDEKRKILCGRENATTNNQMELKAATEGLRALKRSCDVLLYTDSVYVKNGISIWIKSWKTNNWKTSNKKPVKNQELWVKLDELSKLHNISWIWVKGHSGNKFNDEVDRIAKNQI